MRNVTILRTKSSVGALAAFKVYIEDPLSEEVKIDGVPCRKLGELKNGEERNFVVGDAAARIYVIADLLSKNLSNEFYQLPAGTEDIVLSGKCTYNPTAGNPFRFDNNSDEAVLKNRKKNTTRGIIIFIVAALVGIGVGVLRNLDFASEKTFSGSGMEITLTDSFVEDEYLGYTLCYSSRDTLVLALKESFSVADGFESMSLEEYGEALMYNMKNEDAIESDFELKTKDGLTYFEYTEKDAADGTLYGCVTFIYKTDDAFWFVDFTNVEKNADKMKDDIFEWAASVKFE